jgi:hypothetical protein
MKAPDLSSYFTGVAAKTLTAVEADRNCSHQREFNGVEVLRELFGIAKERRSFGADFMHLSDVDDDSAPIAKGSLTWYDARAQNPKRSEHRLYFSPNPVMERAREGDLLVIGLRPNGRVLVIVAVAGSAISGQIGWLFNLPETAGTRFTLRPELSTPTDQVGFARRAILEAIGIEVEVRADDLLPDMVRVFGTRFPGTREFSEFARSTLPDVRAEDAPDEALVRWMEREEALFRSFERHLIKARLGEGFGDDVDEFVSYSLSVQNRRKSRVGFALEHHVRAALIAARVRFECKVTTENRSQPDFIFPGGAEYRDPAFPAKRLLMLGVKSTCKDRWRQVLSEADRIPAKHLLTLETGISAAQLGEMRSRSLQLVIPAELHAAFAADRRSLLISFGSFIQLARSCGRGVAAQSKDPS